MEPIRFHLAFPVADIALTKTYYGEGLGCQIGRKRLFQSS
jgi:extradiol dioxygenase family protein